jgi:2-keto-3-deoxy-L-rhamnonate aldolase RhmA
MAEILDVCNRHGVPFGTTASSAAAAAEWVNKGATFFEADDERALILRAASQLVSDYRRLID